MMEERNMNDQSEKLNFIIPQWQGGGQDLCTWYGAFALRDNYLKDPEAVTVNIGSEPLSPEKNHILGYDDILRDMDKVNAVLKEKNPSRIFTIGGGCDADTPSAAWLNRKYDGDMAVVYIDAHGDLNTPDSSKSMLYYGMSLRTLLSDGDTGIIGRLASVIQPEQLTMCAGRSLDPEESRYIKDKQISAFSVRMLEQNPEIVSEEVTRKGFGHVYIHVDFDSLDPREFDLTPVQEPDGLTCHTLLAMIRALKNCGAEVVGTGLLEYSGTADDRDNNLVNSLVTFGKSL